MALQFHNYWVFREGADEAEFFEEVRTASPAQIEANNIFFVNNIAAFFYGIDDIFTYELPYRIKNRSKWLDALGETEDARGSLNSLKRKLQRYIAGAKAERDRLRDGERSPWHTHIPVAKLRFILDAQLALLRKFVAEIDARLDPLSQAPMDRQRLAAALLQRYSGNVERAARAMMRRER